MDKRPVEITEISQAEDRWAMWLSGLVWGLAIGFAIGVLVARWMPG